MTIGASLQLACVALHGVAALWAPAPRVLTAAPIGGQAISIDGHLDEPAWGRAELGDGFVERVPVPGARPPVDSAVRVLYDRDSIYIGVEMRFEPGTPPVAREMTRDSFRIWSDDAITLKFDVRGDGRTTVGFAVNAAGARIDYVALDGGRTFRREFDAVWESAVDVGVDRWTAEVRIPSTALGLPADDGPRTLRFAASRDHAARNATDDWTLLPPEFGSQSALHYGTLRGLDGMVGGRTLTIVPYVLGATDDGLDVRIGADLGTRLGRDAWGEVTLLTDFAQVDLDDQVVNFDRFPLFLPEKRPFFLSGLDVFQFGAAEEAQVFFSRRIGLDDAGGEVPVRVGAKVYGRSGWLSYGVLDVVSGADEASPAANWGVARVRMDPSTAFGAGMIVATRHAFDDSQDAADGESVRPHYTLGADVSARALDARLELTAFAAATVEEDVDADASAAPARSGGLGGDAAQVALQWKGNALRPSLRALRVSDAYDPALGFVRRRGVVQTVIAVPWEQRTSALGLELWSVGVTGTHVASDEMEATLGRAASLSMAAELRSAWRVDVAGSFAEEMVDAPFVLLGEIPVAAGTYRGPRGQITVQSPTTRNPDVALSFQHDAGYFGGARDAATATGSVTATRHVRLGGSAGWSRLDLPQREPFDVATLNAALTLAPTTSLFADLVGQVNSQTERTSGLVRIRWTWAPGSDVFVVWRRLDNDEQRLVIKATWRTDRLL